MHIMYDGKSNNNAIVNIYKLYNVKTVLKIVFLMQ